MKKTFLITLVLSTLSVISLAQNTDEEKIKGFKKEDLFIGGNVTASFYNGTTSLGLSPYLGYSLNKYLDAAVSLNSSYTSKRDVQGLGNKARQSILGIGSFARIFPIKMIFAQIQFEHNFSTVKFIPTSTSGLVAQTYKQDANSVLLGGGYCNGRFGKGSMFYYFSVMWDVSLVAASPYIDSYGRNFPIMKAGFQFPLFKNKRK